MAPDVTLRATAGVVVVDDDRVLLVRRSDDGTWCLPGGGLEVGETWQEAAVRECREETGWDVRVTGLVGIYSDPRTQTHTYPGGRTVQFVGVVLLAEPLVQAAAPGPEAREVAWFAADALPDDLFEPDRPVLATALTHGAARPVID